MRFLAGIVATLVVLIGGALAIIWTGAYDVAATDRHADPVYWALATTMKNSVERRAHQPPPGPFGEQDVRDGFGKFDAMCVQCHGAPGVEPDKWAAGLRPDPPDLSKRVPGWETGELFWIVKHGIKMSAMPAFGPTHSDEEIWPIVAFLEQLPDIDASAYRRLRETVSPGHHGGSGEGGGAAEDADESAHGGGSDAGHEGSARHEDADDGHAHAPGEDHGDEGQSAEANDSAAAE